MQTPRICSIADFGCIWFSRESQRLYLYPSLRVTSLNHRAGLSSDAVVGLQGRVIVQEHSVQTTDACHHVIVGIMAYKLVAN